ncbi:type II secretion system minor pseudopilin GspJ [uncultured Algimonas sp.]|uniref:type II secretion system minor pseudopilin GspJ n=1 Tax=uncultured Algimonas sp. TaxID=1547920 RepID=UPI00260712C3|nr:type II secretion system minor pseudopilin GspJ [uncultured Algimonas sp.]
MTARDAGFTLVEVLVSMFVFSLISVGALIALTATLDARERSEARIEQVEQLAAARRIMADDFAHMVRRQNRDGLGGIVNESMSAALTDGFELTRRGRPNPEGIYPRGDLLRVGWRVEEGRLIRAFLPHENPAFVEPPLDRTVLDDVEAMKVMPMIGQTSFNSIMIPLDRAEAVSIDLVHADGTTTRHVFEIPDV